MRLCALYTVNNRQSSRQTAVANFIIERVERWLRHSKMALKPNGEYKQNESYYFGTLFLSIGAAVV